MRFPEIYFGSNKLQILCTNNRLPPFFPLDPNGLRHAATPSALPLLLPHQNSAQLSRTIQAGQQRPGRLYTQTVESTELLQTRPTQFGGDTEPTFLAQLPGHIAGAKLAPLTATKRRSTTTGPAERHPSTAPTVHGTLIRCVGRRTRDRRLW